MKYHFIIYKECVFRRFKKANKDSKYLQSTMLIFDITNRQTLSQIMLKNPE
jgi:hypothetical protein